MISQVHGEPGPQELQRSSESTLFSIKGARPLLRGFHCQTVDCPHLGTVSSFRDLFAYKTMPTVSYGFKASVNYPHHCPDAGSTPAGSIGLSLDLTKCVILKQNIEMRLVEEPSGWQKKVLHDDENKVLVSKAPPGTMSGNCGRTTALT